MQVSRLHTAAIFLCAMSSATAHASADRTDRLQSLLDRIVAAETSVAPVPSRPTVPPALPASVLSGEELARLASSNSRKIYDVFVGGVKSTVAVMEGGKYAREITVGKCTALTTSDAGDHKVGEGRIDITPSPECLESSNIDFRQSQGPLKFVDSNSAYLNFAASSNLQTTKGQGGADATTPTISLATGIHAGQHTFYSDAVLDTENNRHNRGDTYITRDIPSLNSRLTVGDVTADPSSSLLQTERIGGINFERNWAQDPDRQAQVYWTPSHTLRLTSKSTVEIYRNGQIVDRRELPAGEYDMRNLPTSGYSSVLRYRITDAFGNVQEFDVSAIAPTRVLRKGELDYSAGLGVKRELVREGWGEYEGNLTGGG